MVVEKKNCRHLKYFVFINVKVTQKPLFLQRHKIIDLGVPSKLFFALNVVYQLILYMQYTFFFVSIFREYKQHMT